MTWRSSTDVSSWSNQKDGFINLVKLVQSLKTLYTDYWCIINILWRNGGFKLWEPLLLSLRSKAFRKIRIKMLIKHSRRIKRRKKTQLNLKIDYFSMQKPNTNSLISKSNLKSRHLVQRQKLLIAN